MFQLFFYSLNLISHKKQNRRARNFILVNFDGGGALINFITRLRKTRRQDDLFLKL